MVSSVTAIQGIAPIIKTILTPSTGDDGDVVPFAAAVAAARFFKARIAALHVRLDQVELAVAMSTEGSAGTLLEGIIDRLTRNADHAEAKSAQALY